MEKLLMLGSSTGSVEIVEHAKKRGLYTIVTDNLPLDRSAAKRVADESWQISTADLDALEAKCREAGVTAIMTGVSEVNIDFQIDLCQRLGLPCYATAESFRFNRDKAAFKEMCRSCGVPVAKDYYLTDALTPEELAAVEYPVVVKPIDQCANRGLSFCNNEAELREGYRLARSFSSAERVIVEQCLTGEEYAAFYALAHGKSSLLSYRRVFKFGDSETPGSYSVVFPTQENIEAFRGVDLALQRLFEEMGCREGIALVQMLCDRPHGALRVIELGYRLDGLKNWLTFDGFDAIQWMLNCATRGGNAVEDLPPSQLTMPARPGCSYIVWSKREGRLARVEGLEEIRKLGVSVHECHEVGETLHPWQYAYIMNFISDGWEAMLETVRTINSLLVAEDECGNDLLMRFTSFDAVAERYQ
ncbi:MAG: hypothetical protein LUD78_06290 [Clostridiales bacterium]|nr:hypothetical protein [Clostridiales bacterium]